MKISLEDYKTGELPVTIDGVEGVVVVASQSSRAFLEGHAAFRAANDYAKKNDIPLEIDEVVDLGFDGLTHETGSKIQSEFMRKAMAKLISSTVVEWPFEVDLFDALMGSLHLLGSINLLGSQLTEEIEEVKKT